MSRTTPDDQLKFLLNCVKHSTNGKIDFVEVAKECGIVSKGAAAKRYERLMKANGIHPGAGPSDKLQKSSYSNMKSKAAIAKAAAAKRRKIEGDRPSLKQSDEEEDLPWLPKMEPKQEPVESKPVKQESLPHQDAWINTPIPGQLPRFHPLIPAYPFSGPICRPQIPPAPQYVLRNGGSFTENFSAPEMFAHDMLEEMSSEEPGLVLGATPYTGRETVVSQNKCCQNGSGEKISNSILIAD